MKTDTDWVIVYLWSGEPWYGLDLIDGDIDEDKIRKSIKVYDEQKYITGKDT